MFDGRWDEGLDDDQLQAVTSGDDPLIILAGAGTGKTRTLTSRVAHLLERGVPPERILLLTFTRRAAEDMLGRATALCGDPSAGRRIWGGTFHAVAHRVISEYSGALGLSEVTVLDPGDVTDLMDLLRDAHGLAADAAGPRRPRAATLAAAYSRAVNTGRPVREVLKVDYPWCEPHTDAILALLREYAERKAARGLLDFDDLLLTFRALLADDAVGERLRCRWDYVLVDEYQDVNSVQVEIVQRLCPSGKGLTVVGDDAQAIYGFRGAGSGHLLHLADSLPQARVVRLQRNFRSRAPLLALANEIRPGDDRHRLTLRAARSEPEHVRHHRPRLVRCHDVADEARQLADTVLEAVDDGGRLRDHAVLMRAGSHSDLLELELSARNVPYVKYGGLKFLEAAHVKDFLSTLRVILNRQDELAWFRLLRLHPGIGPARARSLIEIGDDVNAMVAAAPSPARTDLARSLTMVEQARHNVASGSTASPAVIEPVVAALRPLLVARYSDAEARLADIERLSSAAAAAPDLAAFVADVTLDPRSAPATMRSHRTWTRTT